MPTITSVSEVSICSNALVKIGDLPIMSLDDNTPRAIICKARYPFVRDFVLADFPWPFALKRAELSELVDAPIWGFAHAYQLPSDMLRLVEHNLPKYTTYRLENDTLVTDESGVSILYVAKSNDPTKYTRSFVDALILRLASDIAIPLTKKDKLFEKLLIEYQTVLQNAMTSESQQQEQRAIEDTTLLDVRH